MVVGVMGVLVVVVGVMGVLVLVVGVMGCWCWWLG